VEILGEAGVRISAVTRDLRRVLQRSVNDALSGIRAPRQNALTQLQRDLNRGELDLANAARKRTQAQKAANDAEKELVELRKSGTATTEQLAKAEERHRHAVLNLRVAVDNVNAAQEKHRALQDRLRRGAIDLERDNNRMSRSFSLIGKSLLGVASGMGRSIVAGTKVALIGSLAAGAVAGVGLLTVSVAGLAAALGQAAGAAGLLPAIIAGKWAVIGTAKLAMTGFADAMKAVASGDAAAIEESIKDMAPAAQNFVRELNRVKPAFDDMRLDVQQRMFRGLAGSIQPLADRYLPVAQRLFTGIAGTMNQMAKDVINFAMSSKALVDTNVTVSNLRSSFAALRPAVAPAAEAIMNVVSVGSTFLPKLARGFADAIGDMSARINEMAANGELEAFFQRALDTLRQLGRIAGNIGGIISGVFNAAKEGGAGFLDTLEQTTAGMSRFVNSARGQEAISKFFASLRQIMNALMPVIQELIVIFGTTLAPILANIATTILPALLPLLQAFGRLLEAAAPLIDVLAETLAVLLEALAPVIDIFAQAVRDVMPQLLPALMAMGEALAQLITDAAPLIPLFVQLIAAVLPILPPLIQMSGALLPLLISLIQALMPVIQLAVASFQAMAPVMTFIAQVINAILIPPLRLIATVLGFVVRVAINLMGMFAQGIRLGVQKAIQFFGWLGTLPTKAAAWFGGVLRGAVSRLGALVSWMAGLPNRIFRALGNLGNLLLDAGRDIIMGLLNGLKNAAGAVIDWIQGLLSNVKDAVLSFFGISSPSKMFKGIGENLGQGLIVGIQAITPDVVAAAAAMAAATTKGVQITPTVNGGVSLQPPPSGATPPAGGDGASAPGDLADAMADALTNVQVVVSATEVTSKVNRKNRSNARR
jgi:phage-related protein